MRDFCDKYNVSRETYLKIEKYCQELEIWQYKMNLVSSNTLNDIWERHIEDSAQLFSLIPENVNNILDIGSGAGLPGLIIAMIASDKRPHLRVVLSDSIKKKTVFLNHIKNILSLNKVEIFNIRVEQIKNQKFSVITARAVTSLSNLLGYAYLLLEKGGICIFPKGKKYQQEVEEASNKWNFSLSVVDSKTSEDGKILIVSNIKKKGE